jgi:transcriptional regulator with XRE-family HTH domain
MGLGENVKFLREARNLTYEAVGSAVGTDGQNIFNLEKRKSKVSKFAPALARFFGIDLETLTATDLTKLSIEEARQLGTKPKLVAPPLNPLPQDEGLKRFADLAVIFSRLQKDEQEHVLELAREFDNRRGAADVADAADKS